MLQIHPVEIALEHQMAYIGGLGDASLYRERVDV
jgi:hypothetical protein